MDGLEQFTRKSLAVSSLGSNATQVVAIAGTIHERPRIVSAPVLQDEWRYRGYANIRKRRQGYFGPAGGHFCVVIQQLDDFRVQFLDTSVDGSAKSLAFPEQQRASAGKAAHD